MRTSTVPQRSSGKWPLFLLAVIIALSAYTHMWNPAGFPVLHVDESIYVERGLGILNHEVLYGLHDHPFFGQTVLAGFMYVSGYPGLLDDPPSDPSHLGALYAYPRAFMGLLAVLDTLLVYLIADRMFGRRVAAVAAVIFAVAPMSLLLRMVLLDSILLPFVLSSVLLALHSRGPGNGRRHALLLASGACMGLAVLTKVPAAAMVPPCAILAYWASGRIRDVGMWLAPALAIPAVWPAYAAQAGQLDAWIRDVAWQAGRSNGGLPEAMRRLFEYDPVLIPLGAAGFAFVAACLVLYAGRGRSLGGAGRQGGEGGKKDGAARAGRRREPGTAELKGLGFLAAWFSSILLSFAAIGFVLFYHLSMLLPVLCIAVAVLIRDTVGRRIAWSRGPAGDRTVLIAVTVIGMAGVFTTGMIVYLDVESSGFEAVSFLLQNYSDEQNTVKVVPDRFRWLLSDVYGMQNTTNFYYHENHARGVHVETWSAMKKPSLFYHYVQPDAEKVVRISDSQDRQDRMDETRSCNHTADSAGMRCHNAYITMKYYEEGNITKEFGDGGGIIGVFPPLPAHIERHLANTYSIIEWSPAG